MKILIGKTLLHAVVVDEKLIKDKCTLAIKGCALMGGVYELVRQPDDRVVGSVSYPHFLSRWVGHLKEEMKPVEARLLL